jgi:dephospho-CoA kinase
MKDTYPNVHKSEYAWVSKKHDYYINNDSDLDNLYKKIDNIIKEIQ